MTELPDANVWLALAWEGHAGHRVARDWWESADTVAVAFCRVSQMALLRLLTNTAILGVDTRTQAGAWSTYDALRNSPRVEFAEEPVGLDEKWRSLASRNAAAHKRWTDDYIAAVASGHGFRVITFDDDFRSYPNLLVKLLTMPRSPAAPIS